jgi:uncharacterized protein involved in exopolysaccharide biosynthesis
VENQNQYEEISLVELIVMWLSNWKPAVFWGVVVMVAGMGAVSSLAPQYDSKVKLKIGGINSEELLQLPEALVAQQVAKYKVGDVTQGERSLPRVESVSYDKRSGAPLVEFVARAETAEAAAAYLLTITDKVLLEHQAKYQAVKNENEKLKSNLEQYLSDLKLSQAKGGAEDVNMATVLGSINKASSSLALMSETHLLSAPSLPVKPSAPKKNLFYVLSLIFGFVDVNSTLCFSFCYEC